MQVGIGLSPGVLLGHARAELEMGTHSLLEWFVVRQPRLVRRLHVEGHEPLPLVVRDLQVAVHIDQVLKTKLRVKRSGPPNNSAVKPGQVIDVIWSPLREQRLQHWIGKDLRVEQLLEAVQRLVSPCVLIQTRHALPDLRLDPSSVAQPTRSAVWDSEPLFHAQRPGSPGANRTLAPGL